MFYSFFAKRNKDGKPTAIGSWNVTRRLTTQLNLLAENAALSGKCLEIGPGEGVFAENCRSAGLQYHGIERSPVLQQQLVDRGFDVILDSAPPIALESTQFDFVFVLAVLEHMPTFEQGLQLIQEANRVLKPGGYLAVSVPDYMRGGIDFFAWDYTHSFVMTPLRVQQILGDSGFDVKCTRMFTGSIDNPLLRFPIDLCGFLVHSRLIYWLAESVGLGSIPFKFHKTFQPSIFVIAQKTDAP